MLTFVSKILYEFISVKISINLDLKRKRDEIKAKDLLRMSDMYKWVPLNAAHPVMTPNKLKEPLFIFYFSPFSKSKRKKIKEGMEKKSRVKKKISSF